MKKKLTIFIILFVFCIFLFNTKSTYAQAEVDLSEYFEDSDFLYDMSENAPIKLTTPSNGNPTILDYPYDEKLYTGNLLMTYNHRGVITEVEVLGDDPIVNIIPKKYFTQVSNCGAIGKGYGYYINTTLETNELGHDYFLSSIFIFDVISNIADSKTYVPDILNIKIMPVFQYEYITLNNQNAFPSYMINDFYFEKEVSDYTVVPNPTLVDDHLFTFIETTNYGLNNIVFGGIFSNRDNLNFGDINYNPKDDKGMYFTGTKINFNAVDVEYKEISILEGGSITLELMSKVSSLLKLDKFEKVLSLASKGTTLLNNFVQGKSSDNLFTK